MSILQTNTAEFERSFTTVLRTAFANHHDKPCLTFQDEHYTYGDVDRFSGRIATKLLETGFEKGMHGAVYSANSAIAFIAALGIIKAGGVWIPVNARNSAIANLQILDSLGCEALFFQEKFADTCQTASQNLQSCKTAICLDTQLLDWLGETSPSDPFIKLSGEDILTLPQTGGTTGVPKGVLISHRNFCALDHLMKELHQPFDVMLCVAPMTHAGGRQVLATMSMGLRYVILDKADPETILQTIEDEQITTTFLPPTLIYSLLELPNLERFDLSSLRSLGYGSSPMVPNKVREAIQRIGPVMSGGFGQTECPMSISALKPDEHFVDGEIAEHRLRSVGLPTSISEVQILDDNGQPLPQGQRGEIGVKGPTVCEGYYNAPEETAKIRLNGWHLTGDIGYFDEDGFLYIVDRKKDMIITGGFNVYSVEVESALTGIAGITGAAVIGKPDPKWGEMVAAFIEVDDTFNGEESAITECKHLIGSVKAPKVITVVEKLPRTPVGKIDKNALRSI